MTTPQAPPEPPQVIIQRQEISDALLAMFTALGYVLAPRFLVLLSLLGAFILAVMAMRWHDIMGLSVLGIYCVLTVLPLVWLELVARPKG